jgi:hypothetical protein
MPLMTDTQMKDDWIERVWRDNPCVMVDGGNVRTGPVRLSFVNLFERSKPIPPATEGKYGANLLFPLGVDLTLLENECLECLTNASWYRTGMRGLTMPIKDPAQQPLKDPGGMLKYAGFQAGARYIIATANDKPPVYDTRMSPVVDDKRVYSGVWAFCTLRAFPYAKDVNKGVGFGLQSAMLIADDSSLGGRPSPNPQRDFGGVKIDPAVQPATYFGEEIGKPVDDLKRQLFG